MLLADPLLLFTESRSKYLIDLILNSSATPFDGFWLKIVELLMNG